MDKMLTDADSVTDPTDFPISRPDLRTLDAAFRCPICKDLMSAPVVISGCGHSFCSRCIREALDLNPICPQCNAKANHTHLVKAPAMETAIIAYGKARQEILVMIETLSRASSHSKRKRASSDSDEIIEMHNGDDDVVEMVSPTRHQRPPASPKKRRMHSGKTLKPSTNSSQDNRMIECPACSSFVDMKTINDHMDSGECTMQPSSPLPKKGGKQAWQNLFSSGAGPSKKPTASSSKSTKPPARAASPLPDRLPKEAYDILKEKQIRDRLQKFDLPITGTRKQLQARHEQWVVIYNANQDRAPEHQKTLNQMKAELASSEAERERDVRQRVKAQGSVAEEETSYEAKHHDQFKSLVQQARATKPPKPPQKTPDPDHIVVDDSDL